MRMTAVLCQPAGCTTVDQERLVGKQPWPPWSNNGVSVAATAAKGPWQAPEVVQTLTGLQRVVITAWGKGT